LAGFHLIERGKRVVNAHGHAATVIGVSLALALSILGWHPADLAAQSPVKKSAAASTATDGPRSPSRGGQGIVVVVNDEAITAFEIDQRARLLGLSVNVSEQAKANFQRLIKSPDLEAKMKELQREVVTSNPGKTREQLIAIIQERQKEIGTTLQKQAVESARSTVMPKLKKDAKEELINERLQLQAAKKIGIEVPDDEVKGMLKGLADRNKLTYDGFAQHLKGMGVDISTMTEKFRAQKAWREFVGRRWGAQVSISQREIDQVLSAAASEAGQDAVELQVQKLSLTLPGKADQASLTKRFAEAESLRRRFAGCKSMAEVAKSAPDARFHEMKFVKPSTIGEPMRSMLLGAKDDDVLPPVTTGSGIEIYAVCSRKSAANDSARVQATQQLQTKQLDILAQRHLRNLRLEANIEYK
jgi:peptidyl-prolyl cis-trans isomerase SurA